MCYNGVKLTYYLNLVEFNTYFEETLVDFLVLCIHLLL